MSEIDIANIIDVRSCKLAEVNSINQWISNQ